MKKNNEALESAFESILDFAARETAEKEAEKLKAEAENYKNHKFSKEHNDKMKKIFARERRKMLMKKMSANSKKAACIFIALLLCGTVVFNADALKIKFINYIFDPNAPGTEFKFGYKNGEVFRDDYIELGYLPTGFNLTHQNFAWYTISYIFTNETNTALIDVSVYTDFENGSIGVDTEDGTVDEYDLNGREAVLTTSKNANSIMWHNGEYIFLIASELPQSEVIKIAENFVEKESYKFNGNFSLKYIPNGFTLNDKPNRDLTTFSCFYENDEKYFSVSYFLAKGFSKLTSEDAFSEEIPIKIKEWNGLIRHNSILTVIDIYDGNYVYSFYGNISEDELIKIAENFEPEL